MTKQKPKKNFTKSQITEAITKWEKILENKCLEEAETQSDGDPIPKEDVKVFVDQLAKEVSKDLKEAEGQLSDSELKVKIYDFISTLKTREDLEEFIKNNKVQMEGIQKSKTVPSKLKTILSKIWDILCKTVKFTIFALEHIKTLAIIAAVIFVCVKFEVTPIQAIEKAYEAAKVVYKAADLTVTSAKKATDTYGEIQDTSEKIGDKVGEILGKGYGHAENAVNKISGIFKKSPKPRDYSK